MATFNIKVGDTTPVLEISMKIASSDPVEYWNAPTDKPDGVNNLDVHSVYFTMKNADTNEVVINREGGSVDQEGSRTILRYAWRKADPSWPANQNVFKGDTGVVGTYYGEFEVFYKDNANPLLPDRKRTFPCTPGDELIINVHEDLNGI